MNIRLIKYSTLCMLFALVASCADEELIQTSGYRDGEAVTLSFNISVPAETEVAVTRAINENQVDNLTLLVFSDEGDNAKLEQVCTSYDNAGEEFNKGTMSDGADGTHKKFTVTLEASKEEKAIYILANAGSLLFGDASSIAIGSTTLDDLRQILELIQTSMQIQIDVLNILLADDAKIIFGKINPINAIGIMVDARNFPAKSFL